MSENTDNIGELEAVLQVRREGLDSYPEGIRQHKIRVYEGVVAVFKKENPQIKVKSYFK